MIGFYFQTIGRLLDIALGHGKAILQLVNMFPKDVFDASYLDADCVDLCASSYIVM